MRLIKSAHTVYRTQYHIVWVTRYRRKILNKGIREYLETKLQEARKYYPDWEFIEIGIAEDHLHLHMVIPPKYAVSMVDKIGTATVFQTQITARKTVAVPILCDSVEEYPKGNLSNILPPFRLLQQ